MSGAWRPGPAPVLRRRAQAALADDFLRVAVPRATYRQHYARERTLADLGDPRRWRERARAARARALASLDRYLSQLAEQVQSRGGTVHWAEDATAAVRAIVDILRRAGARLVVKSKSMVTEEIELNRHLEAAGIEVVETDLGEWILQLAGDKPSHLVIPAIHRTREEIRQLLSRAAGRELPDDARALVAFARQHLREKFLTADAGITGANFVVAETGHVVLVTNEGNGRMVTSLPRVHIAVMGMERVVPTWEDLAVLLEVLARSATGQKLTVYTTFAGGVRGPEEADGPEEFHLVVVDNGRSRLLGTRFQEALHCIRCGACLNACPVYRQIGGHAYGGVYSGPIGAVITPLLAGEPGQAGAAWELPYASSLCAACYEACPVMIPLHDLLVELREEAVRHGRAPAAERLAWRVWRWIFASPALYRLAARVARYLQRPWMRDGALRGGPGPLGAWTLGRDFPALAERPFHARWRELAEAGDGPGREGGAA